MNVKHIATLAQELQVASQQVMATAGLLDEGASVPFLARYRKEATGSLDEVAIAAIRDRLAQLEELDKRRDAVLKALDERGQLTVELQEKLLAAESLAVVEDIYLPYRPKRRTRATVAREKGLEPLAQMVFAQDGVDPEIAAQSFIDAEKGVTSREEALAGARDIMAEWVNESPEARSRMRELFASRAVLRSKVIPGKELEGSNYRDYFAWQEPAARAPSHRILAMRRGEKEGFLSLQVVPEEDAALAILEGLLVKGQGAASQQVRRAVQDGYRRLLSHAMETEVRLATKTRADEEAIRVFADNLRQLLLAPPLGQKNLLAVDPGFRTGCKVVCLDRQGKLLHSDAIYPHLSSKNSGEAAEKVLRWCRQFNIEAIGIGNGTAGRETESFIRGLPLPQEIQVVMVNESGASVYSASEAARAEFPEHDITVRGAVSIGRRLLDPLAELVKIDPKSIGVGQYQHDVDPSALKRSLDDVVMSCVNAVGVEVNTASVQLLTYVSGLGAQLAKNIVAYRDAHGPFGSRLELRKVPRLGPKGFEQAAGFLRIRAGENPLDASAVHPESYPLVDAMACDLGCSVVDLLRDGALREGIVVTNYVSDAVGLPTLNDILQELAKPGRDPRRQFEAVAFMEGVDKLEDLQVGMKLPGVVTNITAFGAFVDIGVHQDGLVHISQLADHFVKSPQEVVKVQQKVMVTVLEVDLQRKRIGLSMRNQMEPNGGRSQAAAAPAPARTGKPQAKPSKEPQALFNNPFARAFHRE